MTELQKYEEIGSPLSVSTIKHQIQVIQEVMRDAMVADTHYGTIPGTNKPTLYKAGAEKLCLTFRLAPTYIVTKTDIGNGHREYEVRCTLTHIPTGSVFGEGVGTCSTMESKYRYRNVADFEITDEPIPKDAKERKKEYRSQGFGMKKVEGEWVWVKYKDSARQENPDIADTYNTILKMAKKRAHVDAVLTATAASDIFAQDLEDLPQAEVRTENPAPPVEDITQEIVIPESVKNEVHDKTLAYMEISDATKMKALWGQYGADEQVALWQMFSSAQRSRIKELMKGNKNAA
jgi:uncharacterized protein (UPF0335 family)